MAQYLLTIDFQASGRKPKALSDIFVGIDVWGRGQHGGGKLSSYKALTHIDPESLGLSAAIFTRDLNRALKFCREVDSGNLHVNWGPQWRADLIESQRAVGQLHLTGEAERTAQLFLAGQVVEDLLDGEGLRVALGVVAQFDSTIGRSRQGHEEVFRRQPRRGEVQPHQTGEEASQSSLPAASCLPAGSHAH